MKISQWPATQRPRERLLALGPYAVSDAELVAIFLNTGTTGISAVDLAQQLIERFGSLRDLMAADRDQVMDQPGIGPARYALLLAALEFSRRCADPS